MNKILLGITLACGFAATASYHIWQPPLTPRTHQPSINKTIRPQAAETIHPKAERHSPTAVEPLTVKTKNQLRAERAQARREQRLSRALQKHGMSLDEYPFGYIYTDNINGDSTQTTQRIVHAAKTLTQLGLQWPQRTFREIEDYHFNESLRQAEMRILHKISSSPEAAVAEMKEAIYEAEARYAAREWRTHLKASANGQNHTDVFAYQEALKSIPERYIKSTITRSIQANSDPAMSSIAFNTALNEADHIKYPMLVALLTHPHTDSTTREVIKSHLLNKFGLNLSDPEEIAMIAWDHFFAPLN